MVFFLYVLYFLAHDCTDLKNNKALQESTIRYSILVTFLLKKLKNLFIKFKKLRLKYLARILYIYEIIN